LGALRDISFLLSGGTIMFQRGISWALACSLVALVACGDDTGTGGGGGQNQGGDNQGGDNQGGDGQGGDGQGGDGQGGDGGDNQGGDGQGGDGTGGADCNALSTAMNDALEDAKVCNPGIDAIQCTVILAGPCCDVAVNPANGADVQAYEAAFEAWQTAGCVADCPAVPCPAKTIGVCTGKGNEGTCGEQPG
jgi:hypothetical protein